MKKKTQKKFAMLWLFAFVMAMHLLPLLHNGFGLLAHSGCDCCCCKNSQHPEKADFIRLIPADGNCQTGAEHTCAICAFLKTLQPFEKPVDFQGMPVFSRFAERRSCVPSYINVSTEKTLFPRAPPA